MENNKPDYVYDNVMQINDADASRKFLASVFLWMFVALGISALCAYVFSNSPAFLQTLVNSDTHQLTPESNEFPSASAIEIVPRSSESETPNSRSHPADDCE